MPRFTAWISEPRYHRPDCDHVADKGRGCSCGLEVPEYGSDVACQRICLGYGQQTCLHRRAWDLEESDRVV